MALESKLSQVRILKSVLEKDPPIAAQLSSNPVGIARNLMDLHRRREKADRIELLTGATLPALLSPETIRLVSRNQHCLAELVCHWRSIASEPVVRRLIDISIKTNPVALGRAIQGNAAAKKQLESQLRRLAITSAK